MLVCVFVMVILNIGDQVRVNHPIHLHNLVVFLSLGLQVLLEVRLSGESTPTEWVWTFVSLYLLVCLVNVHVSISNLFE